MGRAELAIGNSESLSLSGQCCFNLQELLQEAKSSSGEKVTVLNTISVVKKLTKTEDLMSTENLSRRERLLKNKKKVKIYISAAFSCCRAIILLKLVTQNMIHPELFRIFVDFCSLDFQVIFWTDGTSALRDWLFFTECMNDSRGIKQQRLGGKQ